MHKWSAYEAVGKHCPQAGFQAVIFELDTFCTFDIIRIQLQSIPLSMRKARIQVLVIALNIFNWNGSLLKTRLSLFLALSIRFSFQHFYRLPRHEHYSLYILIKDTSRDQSFAFYSLGDAKLLAVTSTLFTSTIKISSKLYRNILERVRLSALQKQTIFRLFQMPKELIAEKEWRRKIFRSEKLIMGGCTMRWRGYLSRHQ